MSNQAERTRIDQIVAEYFSKALHIILDSRIPFFSDRDALLRGSSLAASSTLGRNPNKWFNIELEQSNTVEELVEAWRRCPADPMIVDILSQQGMVDSSPPTLRPPDTFRRQLPQALPGSQPDGLESGESESDVSVNDLNETVMERWVVQYERRRRPASGGGGGAGAAVIGLGSSGSAPSSVGSFPGTHTVEVPVVYKRTVILLRSLYCMARTLPAHRLYKLAKASNQCRGLTLSYRVSSSSSALSDADSATMSTCRLTPVDTPMGRMSLTVAYRHATAVTALEVSPPLLPRIITDYVGSPTTDPLRRFPHSSQHPGFPGTPSRRGMHVISMASTPPSSAPSHSRRYSWSPATGARGTFSQPPSYALHTGTPTSPSGPPPRSPSSHVQATASHPMMIHESLFRTSSLSPSPSPSPPTPSHAPEFAIPRAPVRGSSAPVSIPRPSSRGLSMGIFGSPRIASHYRSNSTEQPTSYPSQPTSLGNRTRPYPSQSPPWQPSSSTTLPDAFDQLSISGGAVVSSNGPLNASNFQGRGPLSTPSSTGDSSGPSTSTGMSFSPPLPFASTPVRTTGFMSDAAGGHLDGSLLSVTRASPPISGRQLSLARPTPTSPSYSMSLEARGRLSVSPLAESSFLLSPPHPYRLPSQLGGDELGGFATGGGKRSLYNPPRITFPGDPSNSAASEGMMEDEEFACPFAVDDVDLDDRHSSGPQEASGNWGSPASAKGPSGDGGASQCSPDAELGVLVQMLKAAAPLRPKAGRSTTSMGSSPSQPSTLTAGNGVALPNKVRGGGLSAGLAQAAAGGAGDERRGEAKVIPPRMVAQALESLKEFCQIRENMMTQRGDVGGSVGAGSGGMVSGRSSLERAEGSPRQGSGGLSKRASTEGARRFP